MYLFVCAFVFCLHVELPSVAMIQVSGGKLSREGKSGINHTQTNGRPQGLWVIIFVGLVGFATQP